MVRPYVFAISFICRALDILRADISRQYEDWRSVSCRDCRTLDDKRMAALQEKPIALPVLAMRTADIAGNRPEGALSKVAFKGKPLFKPHRLVAL